MDPYGTRHSRDLFGNLETALCSYTTVAEEERSRQDRGASNIGGGGIRLESTPHPTRQVARFCLVLSLMSATR